MTHFDTSGFVERAHSLHADLHTFAERLSTSSRDAIQAVNPELTDTVLGEEWPLTFDLSIKQRLTGMIAPAPHPVGGVVLWESAIPQCPTAFTVSKFGNDTLREAYGDERPRHAFAADVIGWTQRMEQSGWSLLTLMGVRGRGRVELSVYEDTDKTKTYLDTLVNGRFLIAGGLEPYARISDRVIVDDPGFAAEVLSK